MDHLPDDTRYETLRAALAAQLATMTAEDHDGLHVVELTSDARRVWALWAPWLKPLSLRPGESFLRIAAFAPLANW